ncbi:hypothetical protein SSPIM334S_06115 [Streptomyces spiroverticillatus]|nr:hypothetical protein [Streptomyces finlayi]
MNRAVIAVVAIVALCLSIATVVWIMTSEAPPPRPGGPVPGASVAQNFP